VCRLIDVDALKADYGMAEDCKDCQTGYRSCEYDRIYSKMDFCGWLDDAPTVDAVPVRHGRWEWNGEAFICSACGNGHKGQPTIMGQPMFEFCPMCGADMRKDGEAHD